MSTLTKPNHIGRKISRIGELRDMKQEALAQALGTNQQAILLLKTVKPSMKKNLKQLLKF